MSASVTEIAGGADQVEMSEGVAARRDKLWRAILRNRLATAGGMVVLLWALLAIAAPLITRYDPISWQDSYHTLAPPSLAHLLGTDDAGRDVFSRLAYGGRASLGLGVAMAVGAALGPGLLNAALAMIAVWWPTYARIVRGLVLELKGREFVTAARATGVGEWRILWRTILPNTIGSVLVLATLDVGNAILTVAGLSFIGFGVPPPNPEWGAMISEAQKYPDQWWLALFPGLAIFTAIMGFNFFGDAVRDALDPRTR